MNKRGIGVLSALSLVFAQAGLESTAEAQQSADFENRCGKYLEMSGRAELQNELELLLAEAPDDACIPVLVNLLGSPVARVGDEPFGPDIDDIDDDDDGGGPVDVTGVLY